MLTRILASVSFCAALANIHQTSRDGRTSRSVAIFGFAVLYLVFSIIFGISLEKWDDDAPGKCYVTRGIALPDASHPYVDRVYLGITSLYLFSSLTISVFVALMGSPVPNNVRTGAASNGVEIPFMYTIAYFRWSIVTLAMLQYPLHLYMVITMRTVNRGSLGGDSEDSWGFGQIVALTMLGFTIAKCVEGMWSMLLALADYNLDVLTLSAEYRRLGKGSEVRAAGGSGEAPEEGNTAPTDGVPDQDVALRDMSRK